jgi:hypothetical protein
MEIKFLIAVNINSNPGNFVHKIPEASFATEEWKIISSALEPMYF